MPTTARPPKHTQAPLQMHTESVTKRKETTTTTKEQKKKKKKKKHASLRKNARERGKGEYTEHEVGRTMWDEN
jgi:CelD/BcsL family acetyltransferase involved in cellulose biosynthesis